MKILLDSARPSFALSCSRKAFSIDMEMGFTCGGDSSVVSDRCNDLVQVAKLSTQRLFA